ncbi:amidohydrolase family protein [Frankia sp. CNm7]|uniref:Amidohydrolase family protein n=1 Tax=Frankia nepalensis TaxID=1836974 RepID=A0A937RV31_9ACTN|nr:amidohydrolase family protein [Frankia nepalensis]MBL7502153.1 amidohydrolase family protein [Frankia nepalensis]MBL7510581.1 amidohydrolase family protein [Frankia nepalensis]MBL7523914.1 amidohydrolase family protein [Frankia nepalensis]MBL7633368.1 amidohydrolase family protein [Frankia nepalensis]
MTSDETLRAQTQPALGATPRQVDTIISGALVVTMDAERRVISDGAVAIDGDTIAAVGKTADVLAAFGARELVDGRRFVLTPGLVNTHIHITGEPLTRGYVPDDTPFFENVFVWLTPLYSHYDEREERLSGQLAALEMLRSGTTTFLEAGTIRFLDAVVDGLVETGIRGRVGRWTWDLPPEPEVYRQTTDEAIKGLVDELDRFASVADGRLAAWPILVGHTTCTDELWKAAAELARERGTGLSFHMSPAHLDPEYFLATYDRRPMEHLADLGVLGENVILTHAVHVDDNEIDILAATGTSVAPCPTTALKVSYGITQIGKFPEMVAKGVNVAIGTDGNNASNYSDLMRATYLVAGLFKDGRRDATMFPAEQAFEMATLAGARGLGLEDQIGVLAPGRKADLVAHDTDRPEWRPLLNVANQLVWSADGRGVHSVWVDGHRVVENYHHTTVDEDRLYAEAQAAGEAITTRSGLPNKARWPVL